MPRWRRVALVAATIAAVALFAAYRVYRNNFKRFQEVRPGVLYRMGLPSEFGLRYLTKEHGLRTVVCLHDETPRLKAGLFWDPGDPSGMMESDCAQDLGVRFVYWPQPERADWPWPSPWYFEQYRRLFDDPANWPVLVHCRAGKHRAGTMAALFRLEYDRWDPRDVLDELYSFGFGTPRAVHELNIRTYVPRPRPEAAEWDALRNALAMPLDDPPPADYEELVRRVRANRDRPEVREALGAYLANRRPFAVCLAARLIDAPDDPLVPAATRAAAACLAREDAPAVDWAMSAALVADFGSKDDRGRLLSLLEKESSHGGDPSARYRAMVAGVTNRFTRNRAAYLRPMLDDLRARPEPAATAYRYADTAVARLTSILDVEFLGTRGPAEREDWDRGIEAAKNWFAAHPESGEPCDFVPPEPPAGVANGGGPGP